MKDAVRGRRPSPPCPPADRERFAERTGRRAVEIAAENLCPEWIMTPDAFHNALVTLQA